MADMKRILQETTFDLGEYLQFLSPLKKAQRRSVSSSKSLSRGAGKLEGERIG